MKSIITPKQIKESVVKVTSDDEQGTGFFISEYLLLTALHVLIDIEDINVKLFDNTIVSGKLYAKDEQLDIALVKIDEKQSNFLPLQARTIRYNENWESIGFPYFRQANDLRLSGKVNQIQIDHRSDFILNSEGIEDGFDYSGFSGAPVVLSEKVGGIILQQEDNKLLSISITKVKNFLSIYNIEVEEEAKILDIPREFDDDIKTSTPNYTNTEAIDETIKSSKNWFLFSGSPGSGKTISIASYYPEDDNIEILGKYFIKVPNDKTPKALKSSSRYFLQWLEELLYLNLTGAPSPVEDINFEKRIERLTSLFHNLGSHYQSINKNALLIIDGLDEIFDIKSFLGILPIALPKKIKILLSCISKEILPAEIKSIISQNETIIAQPIHLGQCEAFILKEIGDNNISIENIQELAIKSEGHPLYLRYLVNYIKTQSKSELINFDNWLKQIPTISGDITKYYDLLWDKIYSEPDKLWIVLTLSWLRQSVNLNDLIKMLPEQYKLSFISHFNNLKYLTKGVEYLEIYHNSFKDYIIIKTDAYSFQVNDNISLFCSYDSEHVYSINNYLYHQSLSSDKKKAINYCNQDWADKCALKSVSPELVIGDLKGIINISIDSNQAVETIRLLLLLERIEFRYDNVFAENANLIAGALISLKEFESAIKYLVRDNTLLVNSYDAILFLQLFYENEAMDEARILFEAIYRRYRQLIDEGFKSKEGVDLNTFIMLLNALTLSMNDNFNEGLEKSISLLRLLAKHQNTALDNGDEEAYHAIYNTREYASSWQSAYMLRRFNFFIESEKTAKTTGIKIDEKWAKMRASALILYNEIGTYNAGVFPKTENYFLAIKDVENLIENYGFNENRYELQILINALIEDSKRCDVLNTLITKYLEFEEPFHLRKENGVDLNYPDVYELYFKFKFKGYINDINDLSIIKDTYNRYKKWEEFSISVIKNIAFLEGKAQYYKANGLTSELNEIIKEYTSILSKVDFTFEERMYWERSYYLPEAIYPLIYSKVVNFFAQFSHEELQIYLQSFQTKSKIQAGLYSEGFRKCLFEISSELIKANYDPGEIKQLLLIWSKFVIDNIENRWERTSDLLKIIELYGIISEEEEGIELFKTMLKTSMGPSWYKEAQFELLNTTLNLTNGETVLNKYLKEFTALLDYASGEMTFQRYVRVEKEVFVGNLIKSGRLDIALEYFKSEVIPSPENIIRNAEKSAFDAPRIGDGYCLGARNIKEQNGILGILESINVKSSYLKWALTEIFIINDDVFRYINKFGNIQAKLLNFYEETSDVHLDEFYKSIVQIASSDELKEERTDYLNCFKNQISDNGIKTIQGGLLKKSISWDLVNIESDTNYSNIEHKENQFDNFNKKCLKYKKSEREYLIDQGLKSFQKEKVNIWFSWSNSSDIATRNLRLLFADEYEVFKYLKEYINHYSNNTWSITSKLIWFLEGKLSIDTVEEIYKVIAEHFSLLVRPDKETIAKYDWMETKTLVKTSDELLTKFLIWFLNHPNEGFSKRASHSIQKLAIYEPELLIPIIIEEINSNEPKASALECSLILKNISTEKPELIKNFLEKEQDLFQALVKNEHFTIKKNLLDCAINLNRIGYNKLYNEIYIHIPESIVLVGDVALEEEYLEGISYEISELNDMQILNRKFCESLLKTIHEKCKPLSIDDYRKSDKYLKRSFPNDQYYGRFEEILKYALNTAITSRVDKSNISNVYEILNL